MSGRLLTRNSPLIGLLLFGLSGFTYASTPVCQNPNADPDRDGWGWENNRSCIVDGNNTENFASTRNRQICKYLSSDSNGDGFGWEDNDTCIIGSTSSGSAPTATSGNTPDRVTAASDSSKPVCRSSSSDPDGDGFGWENNQSCLVTGSSTVNTNSDSSSNNSKPSCSSRSSDPDGDGFGWENNRSCIVDASSTGNSASSGSSGGNTTSGNNNKTYSAADITDLLLVTGQSNTLGAGTRIDNSLDSSHHRVFAYTDEGWRVAELYQTWDRGSHPGNGDPNRSNSEYHNNLALHLGKRLATLNANRVVGIILVSEPGEGISHWDAGATGMNRVRSKVLSAINELPQKSALDGIIWHQGETDWLREGTSDPDIPQPAPTNYYPQRLSALIRNFRSENWFNSRKPFICGETIAATGVNTHLMALNSDNDSQTACVEGFGLPSVDGGSHFNASALRTIGQRYADRYFDMTGR